MSLSQVSQVRVSHSLGFDFEALLYEPLRSMSLPKGVELSLGQDGPGEPDQGAEQLERGSVLLIIELSHPCAQSGMELAEARAAGARVIGLLKEGASAPSKVLSACDSVERYVDERDLAVKAQRAIEAALAEPPKIAWGQRRGAGRR